LKKIKNRIQNQFKDTHRKDILFKSGFFIVFKVIGILGGYLFTYNIAQNYGASLNGLVNLSLSVFMIASTFGTLGIDVNLVKYFSAPEKWKDDPGLFYKVVLKSLILTLVLTFILYLCRDLVVIKLFKKPQLSSIYVWAVCSIPGWTLIRNFSGVLRAKGLNNWFSFFQNASRFTLAYFILVSFNIIKLDSLNAIKAHFFAIYILVVLGFIVVVYNFKKLSFRSTSNSWQFLKEAFPMFLSSTIMVFLGWVDSFILGIYVSDEAIGVYGIALKLAMICAFSMEAINSGLAPKIANLYREGKRVEFKKLVNFAAKINFLITAAIVIAVIITNKWLLGLFGEEFMQGTTVLLILCSIHLINSAMGSSAIIMQMTGYQKQYRNIALLSLGVNLILNFALIPKFGITGAAIATAISFTIWNISSVVFLKRKENIITYFNPFYKMNK